MEDCIQEKSKGQNVHHLIQLPPPSLSQGPTEHFFEPLPDQPLSQSCYQELSAVSHFAYFTCSSLESRGNPGGVQRLDSTSPVSPPRQKSHSSDASSWHHPSPMHFFDWAFFDDCIISGVHSFPQKTVPYWEWADIPAIHHSRTIIGCPLVTHAFQESSMKPL